MNYEETVELFRNTGAFACQDCGKCTAVCPVSEHLPFSPRLAVTLLSQGSDPADAGVWDCLTCGRCNVECPSDVRFSELVRNLRIRSHGQDPRTIPSAHGGALHSMMRLAAAAPGKPGRLGWLPEDARVGKKGEVLYFTGCLPLFQEFFAPLGADPISIAKATVKVLNSLGVEPVVMADEVCCGHDLLWSGDEAGFMELARRNVDRIRATGAKTVIFSCAECYRCFHADMQERLGPLGFQALHLADYIAPRRENLKMKPSAQTVTYHDPCRLGRLSGQYQSPRQALEAVPGLELREMDRSREKAMCCGTSLWASCGGASLAMQLERLAEAASTGAGTLVTACPKCRIHFACAALGEQSSAPIMTKDLAEILADALE